jgi:hypothetical protein
MRLLGREPAAKGIIEVPDLPAAIGALQDAAAQAAPPGDNDSGERGVGLKQRLWPMIEMMKRSQAAGEPIVWGV